MTRGEVRSRRIIGSDVTLYLGDCLEILPTLETESVDAVICDPPYPCIKRDYGYWTVDEWWALMRPVVAETRRILKPTGSAVFILQPNSEHLGQMRAWLWEFMAWICREWNMVQDVWWWNTCAIPEAHSIQGHLTRPSLKACVWAGSSKCYRDQEKVLWEESQQTAKEKAARRISRPHGRVNMPGGHGWDARRMMAAADKRGGVTPYNVLPFPNSTSVGNARTRGHGAGTPLKLADWWTRYICPPSGMVADWFMGSGTMGVAAVQNGCGFIGIEKKPGPGYFETAEERIEEAKMKARQLRLAGV